MMDSKLSRKTLALIVLTSFFYSCKSPDNRLETLDENQLKKVMVGNVPGSSVISLGDFLADYKHIEHSIRLFKQFNGKVELKQKYQLPDTVNSVTFLEFGTDTNEIIFLANYQMIKGSGIYKLDLEDLAVSLLHYSNSIYYGESMGVRTDTSLIFTGKEEVEIHPDPLVRVSYADKELLVYEYILPKNLLKLKEKRSYPYVGPFANLTLEQGSLTFYPVYLDTAITSQTINVNMDINPFLSLFKTALENGLSASEAYSEANLKSDAFSKRLVGSDFKIYLEVGGKEETTNEEGLRYTVRDKKRTLVIEKANGDFKYVDFAEYFLVYKIHDNKIFLSRGDTLYTYPLSDILHQ